MFNSIYIVLSRTGTLLVSSLIFLLMSLYVTNTHAKESITTPCLRKCPQTAVSTTEKFRVPISDDLIPDPACFLDRIGPGSKPKMNNSSYYIPGNNVNAFCAKPDCGATKYTDPNSGKHTLLNTLDTETTNTWPERAFCHYACTNFGGGQWCNPLVGVTPAERAANCQHGAPEECVGYCSLVDYVRGGKDWHGLIACKK